VRIASTIKKTGFKKEAQINKKNPIETSILFLNENNKKIKTIINSSKKIRLKELLKKRCVGENINTIELKNATFESE
jgi:hypothetical protein